ncbi:AraC family transcriptional regulator [Marinoscillum sp. 108]|uniref:helix-turn-helix domain-containing protein n=1 Tax=Marinoscillum sp. 108 TaxID=2653151 RepID=UPI0012F1CB48|nr:AraC family transcriptional regulator [Marinoscillum sp. 108]VXD13681.1 AraC-type DNA-binding protein [Marinoscillum sp. 108]
MESTQVNIKGMVCSRCIFTIRESLQKAGMFVRDISLGKVTFCKPIDDPQKTTVRSILSGLGFELVSDKRETRFLEIREFIHQWIAAGSGREQGVTLSESLSRHFMQNYDTLSELFSQMEGKSIEKYHIEKRIEVVKESLVYTGKSLSQIAYERGYSSAHHLSAQFKKVTGLNPSHFKQIQRSKGLIVPDHSNEKV